MYQYAFVCALSLPFQKLQIVLMQEALEEPNIHLLALSVELQQSLYLLLVAVVLGF